MKLEISIHATKLKNVAGAFKGTSDPFAVVTKLSTDRDDKPVVLGKTEVVKNNLNPDWTTSFIFDYSMGTPCKIAINVFDEVRKGNNISMGSAVFDVAEVLGARGNTKAKKLKKGGTMFVTIREAKGSGVLRLKMKGVKLTNVEGWLSKSDPFFEISKKVDNAGGQTWDNVYRSKDVHNNLNPEWEEATLEISKLCGGNLDCPLEIVVYDHESSGKHKLMGRCETTVNALVESAKNSQQKSLSLKMKNKDTGTIVVQKAEISGIQQVTQAMGEVAVSGKPGPSSGLSGSFVPGRSSSQPSFVDYISGGCELSVVVAIDFTGSNGDPRKPGALHYIDANSRNPYQQAMAAIVSILLKYDSDQKIPVLGFGAKYGGEVRHCFQCGPNAEAYGLNGVMEAYNAVFKSGLIMSGPTVFTEVMETAAARARSAQEGASARGQQAYTVLLILTDGAVTDVQSTADCLNSISDSPLSIVIVGIGNADFSSMQFLDHINAKHGGNRDIVQFVPFNQHSHSSQSLTKATLEEIPDQLVSYFQMKNIAPSPAMQRSDSKIEVEEEEEEIDLSLDIGEEEIVVTGGGDDFVNGFNA